MLEPFKSTRRPENLTENLTEDLTAEVTGEVDWLVEMTTMERQLTTMDDVVLALAQQLHGDIVDLMQNRPNPAYATTALTRAAMVGGLVEPSVDAHLTGDLASVEVPGGLVASLASTATDATTDTGLQSLPVVAPNPGSASTSSSVVPSTRGMDRFRFFQTPPPFPPPVYVEGDEQMTSTDGEGDWVDVK